MQKERKSPEEISPIPTDFIPVRENETTESYPAEEPRRSPGRFLAFLLLLGIAVSALAFYLGLNDKKETPVVTRFDGPYKSRPADGGATTAVPLRQGDKGDKEREESLYDEQAVIGAAEKPEDPVADSSPKLTPKLTPRPPVAKPMKKTEKEPAEKVEKAKATPLPTGKKPQNLELKKTEPREKPSLGKTVPPGKTVPGRVAQRDTMKNKEKPPTKRATPVRIENKDLSSKTVAPDPSPRYEQDAISLPDDITGGYAAEEQPRVLPKVDVDGVLGRLYGSSEPAAVKTVKKPRSAGRWWVQIASLTSRERALMEHKRQKNKLPALLGDREHRLVMADLGDKGVFHRVQVGRFADETAARDFCARIKGAGGSCIVVKP